MINLIAPTTTEAAYVEKISVARNSDLDRLMTSHNRFAKLDTTSRFDKVHGAFACMSTLTDDGRCACCLMEFEP